MKIKASLDWKIPFSIGFISCFIVLFLLLFLKNKFIGLVDNQMFNDFYPIFVILIIINCAIATYTISVYYYRISKPGLKGPRGTYGARGEKGEDRKCDITNHKIKTFKLKKVPNPEKYVVDVSVLDNATLDLDKARIIPKWSTSNNRGVTDVSKNILGVRSSSCLKNGTCKLDKNIGVKELVFNSETGEEEIIRTNKPFNGAVLTYSKNARGDDGDIHAIQFTYDKNNKVLKKSKENELLEDYIQEPSGKIRVKDGKIGLKNNKGTGIDFSCPAHSAIYKVETIHSGDVGNKTGGLKGIKFHCRDIVTGEKRRLLNENNDNVYEATYGVEPTPENKEYNFSSTECPNIERELYSGDGKVKIPGFLSNLDAVSGNNTGIQALKFNYCSYYHKNPKEFKYTE